MKIKLVALFAIAFMTASCHNDGPSDSSCEVVVYEECEYFRCVSYYGYHSLTHKGNCKNPIHYCKPSGLHYKQCCSSIKQGPGGLINVSSIGAVTPYGCRIMKLNFNKYAN